MEQKSLHNNNNNNNVFIKYVQINNVTIYSSTKSIINLPREIDAGRGFDFTSTCRI